jgi:hypothetical protein
VRKGDNKIKDGLISQLVAAYFYVPTGIFLWFAMNYFLRFQGAVGKSLGINWLIYILLAFAAISLAVPKLFPGILGRIWKLIIEFFRWN